MALPLAPISEVGKNQGAWGALPGYSSGFSGGTYAGDDLEKVPELQWPNNVLTYAQMRNDSQVNGLYLGSTLPIRRYRWFIDPNGADPKHVEHIQKQYNLPLKDQLDAPRLRAKRRFAFDNHMRLALLAILYGHVFFEQFGEIGDDGLWHLRRLGIRMPQSLSEIKVADDGGLEYIRQTGWRNPPIPVTQLLAYVWDQEGPNWVGRSAFRSCYRDWFLKDKLIRINVINHQRGGGVPWVEAPPGANNPQIRRLDAMAQRFGVHENAGGAVPAGTKLHLESPKVRSAMADAQMHNEEMSRNFLMMFMNLSQGESATGSYGLGQEFVDFFMMAQETTAIWFRDVFNEHQIEDDIDWNFGEDVEQVPLLDFDKGANADEDAISELEKRVQAGENDEDDFDLPEELSDAIKAWRASRARRTKSSGASPKRQRRAALASDGDGGTSPLSLPDRPLRRQPNAAEIAAQVDFAEIDANYEDLRDGLVKAWKEVREEQIDELHAAIMSAGGDLGQLAALNATPIGGDIIETAMKEAARRGASAAKAEAASQGIDHDIPDLDNVDELIEARAGAIDTVMSRYLADAASRKALRSTAPGLSASAVADEVRDHLRGLSDAFLSDQFGGAISAATESGRQAFMSTGPDARYFASELLDTNTCDACRINDGREYDSLEGAEADYPTGGFHACQGQERCRGTIIAVYADVDLND